MMRCWRSKSTLASLTKWSGLFAAALVLSGNVFAATESPIRSMEVTYDGGTYVVNAVMFAPVTQAVAWDVLTDFDHLAKWVPNVAESKILNRDGDSVTFEQHGVARYGAVSFPYTTERKADLKPRSAIKTVQLRGSLRRVESLMMLEPDGNGTRLTYHLEITPSALAATLLSKSFLEHEIGEQFGAIIGEMTHRPQ